MATEQELMAEIKSLKQRIEKLESGRIVSLGEEGYLSDDVVFFRGVTANTPTADGYIDVEINKRRYTLITGS